MAFGLGGSEQVNQPDEVLSPIVDIPRLELPHVSSRASIADRLLRFLSTFRFILSLMRPSLENALMNSAREECKRDLKKELRDIYARRERKAEKALAELLRRHSGKCSRSEARRLLCSIALVSWEEYVNAALRAGVAPRVILGALYRSHLRHMLLHVARRLESSEFIGDDVNPREEAWRQYERIGQVGFRVPRLYEHHLRLREPARHVPIIHNNTVNGNSFEGDAIVAVGNKSGNICDLSAVADWVEAKSMKMTTNITNNAFQADAHVVAGNANEAGLQNNTGEATSAARGEKSLGLFGAIGSKVAKAIPEKWIVFVLVTVGTAVAAWWRLHRG